MIARIVNSIRSFRDRQIWKDLRRFYVFVRPYRGRTLLAMILTMLVGAAGAGVAMLLRMFLGDVILPGGGAAAGAAAAGAGAAVADSGAASFSFSNMSMFYPMLIIVYSMAESGLSFGSEYLTTWVSRRVGNDLKERLFHKLLRVDPAVFDSTLSGEIMIRYAGDADTATSGLLSNARTVIVRVMTSVFLIGYIFHLSWVLSLVTVGALLLTVLPLARVQKKVRNFIKTTLDIGAKVGTNYNEVYLGNRVVTSYNLYDFMENRLHESLQSIFRIGIKMVQRTNVLSLVMHTTTAFGIAAAVWMQGYLISSGHITPEDFITCVTSILILYTPIKKISSNLSSLQNCTMAIQRVLEVLDREPVIRSKPGAVTLPGMARGVRFENVEFAYTPDKPVLRGITLDVPIGRTVALVGSSGSGKTTIVNLLPRFYDVNAGAITIDGVDVRDIELNNLRGLVSIVFQDNFLFGGTIRDNIVLNKLDATQEQIDAAVRAACLDEFVAGLELGLDTYVGERGTMLSGGQRQRVAIARAFLKDAPIVILDEATSALDTKSEAVVQRAIENLMRNKTVFIIAHRLSTVVNADQIVVIREGVIVEQGTHKELMAKQDSVYSSLYKTQVA